MGLVARPNYPTPAFVLRPMDPLHLSSSISAAASRLSSTCSLRSSTVIDGLRTPPPEMTTSSSSISEQPYMYRHVPLKQFNPPAQDLGVSRMVDSFQRVPQNPLQRLSNASPLPRHSTTNISQQNQPDESSRRRSMSSASMTVPASISSTKGNLADFAAQMTCLFWFESTFVLQRVADCPATKVLSPLPPLAEDAVPKSSFRKWVTTILATTQISQNVILLALLFIYRLKKLNPSVQGNPGSEFRLLTVALMLGNKFLDDSTYTNKTWAEVSGISVQEIHVMEVEFLSNMRYSLYVGAEEWKDWHEKLGRFKSYWDRASQGPLDRSSRLQLHPLSNFGGTPQTLPSPPNLSPPYSHSQPPALPAPTQAPPNPPALNPPHVPHTPMPQPDFSMDYSSMSRKRSLDYRSPSMSAVLPPAKRPVRSTAPKLSVTVPQFPIHVDAATTNQPAPPLPPLQPVEYSTPPVQKYSQQVSSTALPPSQPILHPQLPVPGARAMSTVYPAPHSVPHSAPPLPTSTASPLGNMVAYSSHRTSPYSCQSSTTVSPSTPSYAQHSPLWFLGNRQSPYRPVRSVHTLLVPPHSQAMQSPHIAYDQMHYLPLAKTRTEYKTGVVPYLQPEVSWPPYQSPWAHQHPQGA